MIELYDKRMRFVRPIDTAIRCGYAHKLNELPTATLELATHDPAAADIDASKSFLRISDGDLPAGLYRFDQIDPAEQRERGTVTYRLVGAQATLLDDMLIGHHELGGEGLDTRWVIEYILARQTVRRWVLGDCDFADEYLYNFEDVSLLEAIMSLGQLIVEDYAFEFDASGQPPWTMHLRRLSAEPRSVVAIGRNAQGISRQVDGRHVTRLVGRGYGEGDNQLTIAGVNGGLDYLDADTIEDDYDVRVGVHVDRRQTDPQTLKARMAAILEESKRPRVSYEASALDLYRATGERWDLHAVGDMTMVYDEALGCVVRVRLREREKRDIDGDPGSVSLVLDSSVRDVADELNEVLDKIGVQELYAQGATNLYSMQISDSADADHPLVMRYYVPGNVLRINACLLQWRLERFRSYATLAAAGGGGARTSSEGGGATVSIPARTIAAPITSGTPMADGALAPQTGYALASDGTPMGETGETGGTTGGSGDQSTGNARNADGSMSSTGSRATTTGTAGSHSHTTTSSGGTSTGGSHQHTVNRHTHGMSHWHNLDSHTHSVPSHAHDMTHRHAHEHYHLVNVAVDIPAMEFELSPHSHTVSLPEHEHEITHGIYEGERAESVRILVDGEEVPAEEIGEDREVDVAKYMRKNADGKVIRASWHEIEFVPDGLTRITANLFFQVFIQSRGAGDY